MRFLGALVAIIILWTISSSAVPSPMTNELFLNVFGGYGDRTCSLLDTVRCLGRTVSGELSTITNILGSVVGQLGNVLNEVVQLKGFLSASRGCVIDILQNILEAQLGLMRKPQCSVAEYQASVSMVMEKMPSLVSKLTVMIPGNAASVLTTCVEVVDASVNSLIGLLTDCTANINEALADTVQRVYNIFNTFLSVPYTPKGKDNDVLITLVLAAVGVINVVPAIITKILDLPDLNPAQQLLFANVSAALTPIATRFTCILNEIPRSHQTCGFETKVINELTVVVDGLTSMSDISVRGVNVGLLVVTNVIFDVVEHHFGCIKQLIARIGYTMPGLINTVSTTIWNLNMGLIVNSITNADVILSGITTGVIAIVAAVVALLNGALTVAAIAVARVTVCLRVVLEFVDVVIQMAITIVRRLHDCGLSVVMERLMRTIPKKVNDIVIGSVKTVNDPSDTYISVIKVTLDRLYGHLRSLTTAVGCTLEPVLSSISATLRSGGSNLGS